MLGLAHPPRALVERIVACEDRLAEAGAEVLELDVGRVMRQPAYPHVFDANLVRHPRLERVDLADALARLEEPLRAVGAAHIQISADPGALPELVAVELRRRSFLRDRLLVMALGGPPARRPVPGVEVLEVPGEAPLAWYASTMDRMSREEPWYTPQLSREVIGSLGAKAAVGAVALHVGMLNGSLAGAVGLALGRSEATAGVATVMTVGTVPEARGRGVAQTMVVRLVEKARRAGCDLVYLVARADDTPKDMYRKLGFEVVYGFDVWLRPPWA